MRRSKVRETVARRTNTIVCRVGNSSNTKKLVVCSRRRKKGQARLWNIKGSRRHSDESIIASWYFVDLAIRCFRPCELAARVSTKKGTENFSRSHCDHSFSQWSSSGPDCMLVALSQIKVDNIMEEHLSQRTTDSSNALDNPESVAVSPERQAALIPQKGTKRGGAPKTCEWENVYVGSKKEKLSKPINLRNMANKTHISVITCRGGYELWGIERRDLQSDQHCPDIRNGIHNGDEDLIGLGFIAVATRCVRNGQPSNDRLYDPSKQDGRDPVPRMYLVRNFTKTDPATRRRVYEVLAKVSATKHSRCVVIT